MYLKCLAILEKASISLKKSSKKEAFSGVVFQKPHYVYKFLILILHFWL
jgi:hypothetical protein